MIIQGLQAENLFKYTKISLSGLEGKGRIILSGPNESGKTAVVEALCLGLFGRTVALEATQLAKVVKWGKEYASVALTFLGQGKQSYTVFRHIDATGQSQVNLNLVGTEEPIAKGMEAVQTALTDLIGFGFQSYKDTLCLPQNTPDTLFQEETIQSLAGVLDLNALAHKLNEELLSSQEQVDKKDAQIQILEARRGTLGVKEEALGLLEKQKAETETQVTTIGEDMDRWKAFAGQMQQAAGSIESLVIRLSNGNLETSQDTWRDRAKLLEGALDDLDRVCKDNQVEVEISPSEGLRTWRDDLWQRLSALKPIMESVTKDRFKLATWLGKGPERADSVTLERQTAEIDDKIVSLTKKRKRNGRLAFFSLMISFVVGGFSGLLHFQPEHPHTKTLLALLKEHLPAWHLPSPSILLYYFAAAAFFLILALYATSRSMKLRGKVIDSHQQLDALGARAEAARKTIDIMDAATSDPLTQQIAALVQLKQFEWAAALENWAGSSGTVFLEKKAQKRLFSELATLLGHFRKEISAYDADIEDQIQTSLKKQKRLSEQLTLQETRIDHEKARRVEDQGLRTQVDDLLLECKHEEHAIEVRRIAGNLLAGSCKGLTSRFNQELRRFIVKSAPLFTQGRYEHLRIGDNLNIAAFSPVKNDFVDFNEMSTGLRYQLLLAVRMAVSQALIARINHHVPHFMVLDEPFVFFDRERVRESLDGLLKVSDQITQTWITIREYDEAGMDATTDLHLPCAFEKDALVVA